MKNSSPTQKVKATAGVFSWLPSHKLTKLSSFLLYLILIFASTQLGIHFWPDSTLIHGIRVDYLSPVIYFLDLLIIGYLIARRSVLKGVEAISPDEQPGRTDLIGTLAPILLANLLFSLNPLATLSWSLHLFLYLCFILSLPKYSIHNTLYHILPITMLFQVVLGAFQVALGHTLQGPLYYLGERALSVGTPNVARAEVFGNLTLRAYGTFSHPNILAGWLVAALLILIHLLRSRNLSPIRYTKYKILYTLITALGILLTESRSAALALFGIIIPFYILKKLSSRTLYFVVVISLCTMYYVLSPNILSRPHDTSFSDRLTLQNISLQVIKTYPIFGTGAGASISTYPTIAPQNRLLQPDHNSATLLLSWFGIFGIATLTLVITSQLRKHRQSLVGLTLKDSSRLDLKMSSKRSDLIGFPWIWLLPLLPLLLLDHYLLTSPQGMLILLLYLRATIFS